MGYPKVRPHCNDVGHLMKKVIHEDGNITQHYIRTVHTEQNTITQAARRGIALEGATLYVRMTPYRNCTMLIINTGIEIVVCQKVSRSSRIGSHIQRSRNKTGIFIRRCFEI